MKKFYGKMLFVMLITGILLPRVYGQDDKKKDYLKIGGAVRYNVVHTNYESDPTPTSTYATWDTWRLNVDASKAGLDLSFEYRWYPTFGTNFIHHGWIGYGFSDKVYMKLGVSQVPFGITKYASHSWWFQGPYYVGLEDDYDMGLKFDFTPGDKLKLSVAYYRQAEPEGPYLDFGIGNSGRYNVTYGNAGPGRYSYDITSNTYQSLAGNDVNIRELNTFNLRAAYMLNEDWEVGLSGQFGGIYNSALQESDMSTAFAAHAVGNFGGGFNLKAEYVYYDYNARDNAGQKLELVQMGAYGSNYPVAARAAMYVAGLAYSIDVNWGPISNIQPYVDYTYVDKSNENFYDTQHLIPGFLVTAGNLYTYVDYAMGKNQPWLTDNFGTGLGTGVKDPQWNTRFNINLGYYF